MFLPRVTVPRDKAVGRDPGALESCLRVMG